MPLVVEAYSWRHGTFLGATAGSETTAAAAGQTGVLRRDPMAMLPFCGYHMGDYFAHWLSFAERPELAQLPRIFCVNWFRRGADGRFLWPGYGENGRVLKWIFERLSGTAGAVDTPIGRLPADGALDVSGFDVSAQAMRELLRVDADEWRDEVALIEAHFARFGDRLPAGLRDELHGLEARLATPRPQENRLRTSASATS
jgi:phosphoenolpyruvate carboxykinase (GTP)